MKNSRQFYSCSICGNIVGLVQDGGGTLFCCGQEMQLLTANTTDAAQEKHVPMIKREGEKCTVEVGSVTHPMTEEHHIAWIAVAQDKNTHRAVLDKTGKPAAEFCIGEGPVTVYAYCNLHGLWAAEA